MKMVAKQNKTGQGRHPIWKVAEFHSLILLFALTGAGMVLTQYIVK